MTLANKLVLVSVVVLLIFTSAYIVVITQNIPFSSSIALFNWNPPESEKDIPMILSFPESTTIIISDINDSRASVCTIKFLLKYNGTLTENTPIEVVNASCINYLPTKIAVDVGFPQAIACEYKTWIGNKNDLLVQWSGTDILSFEDNRALHEGDVELDNIDPSNQVSFYFPVSGDYSPIITIYEKGLSSNETPIMFSFDQIKIHVALQSEIDQMRISKINLGLTVALFGFSYIGGFALIYDLLKKEKGDKKEVPQFPININIISETKKTTPKTNEAKISSLSKVQPYTIEQETPKDEKSARNTNNIPRNDKNTPN